MELGCHGNRHCGQNPMYKNPLFLLQLGLFHTTLSSGSNGLNHVAPLLNGQDLSSPIHSKTHYRLGDGSFVCFACLCVH